MTSAKSTNLSFHVRKIAALHYVGIIFANSLNKLEIVQWIVTQLDPVGMVFAIQTKHQPTAEKIATLPLAVTIFATMTNISEPVQATVPLKPVAMEFAISQKIQSFVSPTVMPAIAEMAFAN